MILNFATGNKNKAEEAKAKLAGFGIQVVQLKLPYPEMQADALEEVASQGLDWLCQHTQEAVMLDDAGLFIDAFDGFPGVYSAYVFKTLGNSGILKLLEGNDNRAATFKACIGLRLQNGSHHFFNGECKGTIIEELRGEEGFGYDPIFVPEEKPLTFAQMGMDEKNELSHRGRAFAKMAQFLAHKNRQ